MPRKDFELRTVTSVVKREAADRRSRDEAQASAGIGELPIGTVARRAADGALSIPAAGADVNCILLERIEAGNSARRVVVLSREAQVVRQELRFPAGFAPAEVDAAIEALRGVGIIPRAGV